MLRSTPFFETPRGVVRARICSFPRVTVRHVAVRLESGGNVRRGNRCQTASKCGPIGVAGAPARELQTPIDRSVEGEDGDDVFQWTKHWYPMVPLKLLEESQDLGNGVGLPEIQKRCILGKDVVLWKDSEGRWRAVEDKCAHRLAALSMGRVREDGTLECRYHGWCFNGRGDCTHVPQAPNGHVEETVCRSSRSKVQAYPTKEAHGLLWLWPDDSPAAWEESGSVEPTVGFISGPDAFWDIIADFPCSYGAQAESLFDPSHTLYLHSGRSIRRGHAFDESRNIPMTDFRLVGDVTKDGFTMTYGPLNKDHKWEKATHVFKPPQFMQLSHTHKDGQIDCFQIHFTPSRPGHTQFLLGYKMDVNQVNHRKTPKFTFRQGAPQGKLSEILLSRPFRLLEKFLPMYLLVSIFHNRVRFGNQDVVAQHVQDLRLPREPGPFESKVYLATNSDVGVRVFRQWLQKYSDGEPKWLCDENEAEAAKKISYADQFDRWERHTKWCPTCRKSLRFLERAEAILTKAAAVFLACAFVLAAVRSSNPRFAVLAAVAAGTSFLVRSEAQKLRTSFLTNVPQTGIPEVSMKWPS